MAAPSSSPSKDSDGTGLIILIWVLGGIATLVVTLRVIAKVRIRHFRLDDVVMLVALTFCLTASCLSTTAVTYGYGQRSPIPAQEDATKARQFYLIGQAVQLAGTALARTAFVLYLLAILGSEIWQRIALITLTVLGLVINFVSIVLIFSMCQPLNASWDYHMDANCWPLSIQLKYSYFQSTFNTFIDLYLAVVPTWIFWHLNLRLRIKLSLITLMLLGLIAMAAALAKTIQLHQMTDDMLTGTVDLLRWGYLEGYLVVITASLPCLRSLTVSFFRYLKSSSDRSRYELRVPYARAGGAIDATTHTSRDRWTGGILSKSGQVEDGASVDYILGSRENVDGIRTGGNGSSQDLERGQKGPQKLADTSFVHYEGPG